MRTVRPSSLALFLHCPGSARMAELAEEQGVREPPNEAMVRGTRIHEAIRQRTVDGLGDEDAACVRWAIQEVDSLRDCARPPVGDLVAELRYSIPVDKSIILSGQIDAFWTEGDDQVTVIDYKTGHRHASHWLNYSYQWQMAAYCALASAWTGRKPAAYILWVDERDVEAVDPAVCTLGMLLVRLASEAWRRVQRFMPGPWCDFCRGAAVCPALRSRMEMAMGLAEKAEDPVQAWIAAAKAARAAERILETARRALESLSNDELTRHGIRRFERISFEVGRPDASTLRRLLDEYGPEAMEAVRLSWTGLRRALAGSASRTDADVRALAEAEKIGLRVEAKKSIVYSAET